MRRFIVLLAGGVAIYILYPAAPPWMAASPYYPYRAVDGLTRHSSAGWYWLHLSVMGDILNRGQEIANPVAAMPSLHAAFALLVVAFFMPGKKWWVKGLMLLFPLTHGVVVDVHRRALRHRRHRGLAALRAGAGRLLVVGATSPAHDHPGDRGRRRRRQPRAARPRRGYDSNCTDARSAAHGRISVDLTSSWAGCSS